MKRCDFYVAAVSRKHRGKHSIFGPFSYMLRDVILATLRRQGRTPLYLIRAWRK